MSGLGLESAGKPHEEKVPSVSSWGLNGGLIVQRTDGNDERVYSRRFHSAAARTPIAGRGDHHYSALPRDLDGSAQGVASYELVVGPPSERLMTRMLYRALLPMTHWMPASTEETRPLPWESRTRTSIRLAPGAIPT